MNEFLKMDAFFFITSIAAIISTVLLSVLLVYLIIFMRDLKSISKIAKIETEQISADIKDLRQSVKKEGFKIKNVLNFFRAIIKKYKKGK